MIVVLNHVPHCYTSQDGAVIRALLAREFDRGQPVTLSFSGVSDVPSSFVNAALVPFVQDRGTAWVKANLRIVGATKQVANMIRRCVDNAQQTLVVA